MCLSCGRAACALMQMITHLNAPPVSAVRAAERMHRAEPGASVPKVLQA